MDSGVIKNEHKKIKTMIVDQALPLLCIYTHTQKNIVLKYSQQLYLL